MASNSVNFKVFLRDQGLNEARRFTVDAGVATNYTYFNQKIRAVFPSIREAQFTIKWKDADGDEISIDTDEDLITAFTEIPDAVKVLYVTVLRRDGPGACSAPAFDNEPSPSEAPFRRPRIVCDICNQTILGYRYKCLQCPDYDLCGDCEHVGYHSDHLMIRVPYADMVMPKCYRKFAHSVARNLKKSAYSASKEVYRAAKHAYKVNPVGKAAGEGNKPAESQPQTSTSNDNPQESQYGCPFVTGETINMNDIHALGAMARQHLGPLLDAAKAPQAPPSAPTDQTEQGLFINMIRNAVDGFFGVVPDETPTQQNQAKDGETNKQPTTKAGDGEQPTPMDVAAPPETREVIITQTRDPGWTFIENNQANPTETTAANAPNEQPTAPAAFVYHDNPKIAQGLAQLYEMGFSNHNGFLTHLLERTDGNVAAVVKAVVDMEK